MLDLEHKIIVLIDIHRKIIIPHKLDPKSTYDLKETIEFQRTLEAASPQKTSRNLDAIKNTYIILDMIREFKGSFQQFYIARKADNLVLEVAFPTALDMISYAGSIKNYSGIKPRYAITTAFRGNPSLTVNRTDWSNHKKLSRIFADTASSDDNDTEVCLKLASFFITLPDTGKIFDIRQEDNAVVIDVIFKSYVAYYKFKESLLHYFA